MPFHAAVRPEIARERAPACATAVLDDNVPEPNTRQPLVPSSVVPLVIASVTAPPPANCHQLTLNSEPPPPVKRRYRSCVPVAPLTGQVTVVQVCQPPVPGTAQVPTTVPLTLPRRSSMVPPDAADATRAENDVAPPPKATPLTLM
jgi:hypothetical protein